MHKVFNLIIGIISFFCICSVAPLGAGAKTISDNVTTASDTILTYFDSVYKSSSYDNYLLGIEYTYVSNYSYTTYYYLCLTDSDIEYTSSINATASCDEMYVYYRNSSSDYQLSTYNDDTLTLTNSIFYSNAENEKSYINESLLFMLNIGLFTFFLTAVLIAILGGRK